MSFSDTLASAIRSEHVSGTLSLVVQFSARSTRTLSGFGQRRCHPPDFAFSLWRPRGAHAAAAGLREAAESGGRKRATTRCPTRRGSSASRLRWSRQAWTSQPVGCGWRAAPWPSALQRLGRLNRDGRADGKSQGVCFRLAGGRQKGKGQPSGPYEAKDIEASIKLLTKLAVIYENEPMLGAADAIAKLRASSAAEIDAALAQKDEPFPRAMDVHGLFSTEPDVFGGF